jgi:hypothetical protein
VAEVAAGVDDELGDSGVGEDGGDEVDEVALAGGADVDDERSPGDERCAVALDVGRPCGSCAVAGRRWGGRERVRRVVVEELELAADERVDGAFGGGGEPVVEVEQGGRVLGKLEPAARGSGGDPGDQGVGTEARVGRVEPSNAVGICSRVPALS